MDGDWKWEDASVGIRSGDWNGTWPTIALDAPINNTTKCPARFGGYILLFMMCKCLHHRLIKHQYSVQI